MIRTTRRIQWTIVLGVSSALLCSSVANAQDSGSSSGGPPGGYPGGSSSGSGSYPGSSSSGSSSGYSSGGGSAAGGAGSGLGSVSNESVETTTVTTTGTEFDSVDATTPLPNTGGEPLLMAMFGSLIAGSALLLRRKLS